MELPQVARYTKDQKYLEHYDGIDPHSESGAAFCKNGGQRVCTVLVYINDVEVGGCTFFRKLNLRIKPKAGMALVFFPAFTDAELDTNVIHCAEPAVDPKFVSQVWLRQFARVDGQPSRRKEPVAVDGVVAGALPKQRLPVNVRPYGAGAKLISEQPPFWTIDHFLSKEECAALIQASEGLLDKSKTHAAPGGGVVASGERTSYTCHLDKKSVACQPFLRKVETLTAKPFDHMELPQVARYTKDQRYLEHYDGIDPHSESGAAFCKNGGQRVCTVLVYLNDVEVGGCTFFRKLNLRVKPKAGMALVFFPAFLDGDLDTDLIHCAEPAVDQKWVAQVWLRQRTRVDGQPSRRVAKRKPRNRRGCFDVEFGFIPAGADMHTATMTIDEARTYCKSHAAIQGFTFQKAIVNPEELIHVWFKSTSAVVLADGWTSYVKSELAPLSFHVAGCTALKKVLLARGWEEEDDGRPASFTLWPQDAAGAAEHAAMRLRLFAPTELLHFASALQHARALLASGAGARAVFARSTYGSLRDALEGRALVAPTGAEQVRARARSAPARASVVPSACI
jgi:prolyl 4-hydroxylase